MRKILCVLMAVILAAALPMSGALATDEPAEEIVLTETAEETAEPEAEEEEPPAEAAEEPEEAAAEAESEALAEPDDASGDPEEAAPAADEAEPLLDGAYSVVFDNSAWSYDSKYNVWYQIGVVYCAAPATTTYETLGIYVPGAYMTGVQNSSGKYTCTVNASGSVGSYTAATAPIVMPMNTPGYSAQAAPTSYKYSTVSSYMSAGIIYVAAGCRGRNNGTGFDGGAPWGVTDIKAAIRYLRYNAASLPGSTEHIFVFGHSGGGAQTSLVGTTGDSALYTPYLESIGACMTYDDGTAISDTIFGANCWCPITSLDMADAAYEWNMGQYSRTSGTFAAALSADLASAYGEYLNALGLKDGNGTALTLSDTGDGVYTSGTYYDFMLAEIDRSLNNYIADNGLSGASVVSSLGSWVTWDGTQAHVSSLADFAAKIKKASKSVPAFDSLNRSAAENYVFGDNTTDALHFDALVASLLAENAAEYASLSGYSASYASAYAEYLSSYDALGIASLTRQDMYNPMYFISSYYDGYGTAAVAPNWRIHSGITQGDTSLCVEMNLALALQAYGVDSLDFEMVWGKGHTEAERTGSAAANFIAWVNACMAGTNRGSTTLSTLDVEEPTFTLDGKAATSAYLLANGMAAEAAENLRMAVGR